MKLHPKRHNDYRALKPVRKQQATRNDPDQMNPDFGRHGKYETRNGSQQPADGDSHFSNRADQVINRRSIGRHISEPQPASRVHRRYVPLRG